VYVCSLVTIRPSDTKPKFIIINYLFLGNKLETQIVRVIAVGELKIHGFDWKHCLFLPNSNVYSKLKRDVNCTSTWYLNFVLALILSAAAAIA
jgi:hypothetical protein